MKDFLKSSGVHAVLWILGGLILLLVAFGFGAMVGYREASYAGNFGNNYYRNFYGPPMGQPFFNPHGVAGEVIDLSSSTISVKDLDGDEHSVMVASSTAIREGSAAITIGDIHIGDMITVIGAPNGSGQVEARLVRVISTSSSIPVPPPMPGTNIN